MKAPETAGMPSIRITEVVVASLLMAFGAVVMWDSARVGSGWGADGPGAGYFPFYIGLLIVLGSAFNLVRAVRTDGAAARRLLFDRRQLRSILSVLVPAAAFVAAIPFIGIYVAAALYIGFFMRWLGRFKWSTVLAVSVGVPVAAFLTFETWFLVALPKGPVEDWLGF
jgi:hypothetical protein